MLYYPPKIFFLYIFFKDCRNPFIPMGLKGSSLVMSTRNLERTFSCLTQSTSHGTFHYENTAITYWEYFILFLVHTLLYSTCKWVLIMLVWRTGYSLKKQQWIGQLNFQQSQTGFCSYHKIVPSFIAAVKNIMLARPLCFKHLTLLCHLNYPSKVTFSNERPLMSFAS